MGALHGLVLYERQHTVAATEAEQPYLEKRDKQVEENHDSAPPTAPEGASLHCRTFVSPSGDEGGATFP